jgi:Skp family chaperone for outer membrane proteins
VTPEESVADTLAPLLDHHALVECVGLIEKSAHTLGEFTDNLPDDEGGTSFDSQASDDNAQGPPHMDDVEAHSALTSLAAAHRSLVHQLEQDLNSLMDGCVVVVAESFEDAGAAFKHTAEVIAACETELAELVEQLAGVRSSCHSSAEEVRAAFEQSVAEINEAADTFDRALSDVKNHVDHELHQQVQDVAQQACRQLQSQGEEQIVRTVHSEIGNWQQEIRNSRQRIVDLMKDRENDVRTAFSDLSKMTQSELQRRLEAALSKLVNEVLERLARSVQEAIQSSTLGAQVTSVMSPILPQLILFNRAADALLDAIRVFKAASLRF